MLPWSLLLSFFLLLSSNSVSAVIVSLKTSTQLPHPVQDVYQFLATPSNWPDIVLSSVGVEYPASSASSSSSSSSRSSSSIAAARIGSRRMLQRRGDTVTEIFGLPPIWLLSIAWRCRNANNQHHVLEVESVEGVPGIATHCRMLFQCTAAAAAHEEKTTTTTTVHFTMEYEPQNALAYVAIPFLVLDNAIAVKWLLRKALMVQTRTIPSTTTTALDAFYSLMGTLYGIAGVLHAVDCLLGPSQLLLSLGSPVSYYQMPPMG
jgi:hypothetical protein